MANLRAQNQKNIVERIAQRDALTEGEQYYVDLICEGLSPSVAAKYAGFTERQAGLLLKQQKIQAALAAQNAAALYGTLLPKANSVVQRILDAPMGDGEGEIHPVVVSKTALGVMGLALKYQALAALKDPRAGEPFGLGDLRALEDTLSQAIRIAEEQRNTVEGEYRLTSGGDLRQEDTASGDPEDFLE